MIASYYIIAATQLELITEESGHGIDNESIILPNGDKIAVSSEVKTRATYLYNLDKVRKNRNILLADTDWVGNTDVPESELVTQLRTYRQALRDITNQVVEGQPLYVVWPNDPRGTGTEPIVQTD